MDTIQRRMDRDRAVDQDCGGRGLLGSRVQILKELHRGADWQPI